LIKEMAHKVSKQYGVFRYAIEEGIIDNKEEIRTWLKANKKKLIKLLKKL